MGCKECGLELGLGVCRDPLCNFSLKWKISQYTTQLSAAAETFEIGVKAVVRILADLLPTGRTIFLTGIGKSGLIARKSVATWQSLGLPAQNISVQDMCHGDLGILRPGDVIVYVSNSGATDELMSIAQYVSKTFEVKQLAVTANRSSPLSGIVDVHVPICDFKIQEADICNLAPTVSAVLFMVFLDVLGMKLAEFTEFSAETFRKYHPGGALVRNSS